MNELIKEANKLLNDQSFEYAVCGGFAIDLFLGNESRKHGDIDISAYWKDRNAIIEYMRSKEYEVFEMLGEGKVHRITDVNDQMYLKRNIFCQKDNCELVQLWDTSEKDIYFMDFKHIGLTKLNFVEFLFNNKSDTDFLYARNEDIKRSLEKAVLFADGIPYLAPEICLLYKSTDIMREGYQQDYEKAFEKMSREQRDWLNYALYTMYPEGHKWIKN